MGSNVNLDPVKSLLNSENERLGSGLLNRSDFFAGWGDPPEIQEMFNMAVDYKRRGDLAMSNKYFCESFRRLETFHSPFVWSWCKTMILAKNWLALRDLLEHHFYIMVVWNRLMREEGNQAFFDSYRACNMVPYFEFGDFHAGEHLRDQVHSPLMEKEEATIRLSQFGGSPYWDQNYRITDDEWGDFIRIFPLPEV